MKEKKLIDEEIIKALEICANWNSMSNCKDCPIGLDACCENQNGFATYALDLIRRLQYGYSSASKASEEWKAKYEAERKENADYESKIDDGDLVSKEWHDEQVGHAELVIEEQKVEIERLTEENEYLDGCAKQFLADYQKCEIANTELQELNAKYYNEAKDLRRENAELQKQVDELTDKLGKVLSGIKADEVLVAIGVEQAVKDIAKKILQYVGDLYDDCDQRFRLKDYQWHKNLCKRFGVEVE